MCICVYILTYMNNSFEIGAANGVLGGRWSIWRAVGAPISNERAPAFTVQGKLRQGAREHTSLGYQMSETDSLSTGIYNVKHSERECLGPFHLPGSHGQPPGRHVCLEQSPSRKAEWLRRVTPKVIWSPPRWVRGSPLSDAILLCFPHVMWWRRITLL